MRKLKILVATMALTLLMATPAFAQVFGDNVGVATTGGDVAVNSFNNSFNTDSFNTGSFNTDGFDPGDLTIVNENTNVNENTQVNSLLSGNTVTLAPLLPLL